MSSHTLPPGAEPPEAPPLANSPYEAAIEDRLQQTRRQVKSVDLAASLLALGAATLVYLFAFTLLDQWLIPRGMGFGGRLVAFVGLLGVMGYYLVRRVLPLLVYKINPLFAAHTIEQSRPSLKNSLINFLFLRQHRQEVTRTVLDQRIYEGLEHSAARELAHIPAETVVDRSQVIRLGYLLAAVLAICCLYLVLSPKNPLVSFSRAIWPWAEIQVPTRVTITAIEPGDTVAFQGDTLTISAEVQGLQDGETVTLYYTTADKQSVNQAIPMSVPDKGYRYQCDLPPDPAGLQQNVTYYLQAGDAQTRRFTIDVQTALAILVDRVDYDYPDYTGLADTSAKGSGDIHAIEGTKVTIHGTANQPIERAMLEMNCDPRNVLAMRVQEKQATGQFRLQMDPADPLRPKYNCYQIRFRDHYNHENPRPIRHQIDVVRDQPPEIQFVDPPAEEIQLPVNGALELKLRAQDPDFGLRRVVLHAERDKRSLPIGPLLENRSPEKAHRGPFEATYRFEPAKLGLKVDDRVVYWAEARDNKEAEPNRSETPRRWITIVAAEKQPPDEQPPQAGQQEKQPPKGEQPKQQPDQPQQGQDAQGQQEKQPGEKQPPNDNQQEKPGDQPQNGQENQPSDQQQGGESSTGQGDKSQNQTGKGSGEQMDGQEGPKGESGEEGKSQSGTDSKGDQQQGQDSRQPSEPIDPDTNPGDAFEKILEHRNQQQSKNDQPNESKPNQGDQSSSEQSQPKPGEQQQQQSKPGEQQQGQQPSGESKPGQQGTDSKQAVNDGQKQPAGGQEAGSEKPSSKSGEGEKTPQEGQGRQEPAGGESNDESKPEGVSQGKGGQDGQEKQPSQEAPSGGEQQAGKGPRQDQPPSGKPDQQGGDDQPGMENTRPGESKQSTDNAQRVEDQGQDATSTGQQRKSESGQNGEEEMPSNRQEPSDSQGETGGDRSGGGQKGGGQKSEQSGTGSDGSHTEAEQGADRGQQPGQGQTGEMAGEEAKADRPTGSESKTPDKGQGAGQQQKPGGQKPGAQKPGDQKQKPGDKSQQPEGDASSSGQSGSTPQGGAPDGREQQSGRSSTTGGEQRPNDTPPEPPEPEVSRPDEVNRKYAEEAVNLSLETLEEQLAKDKPDPALLDRLGWSRDELERFYRQWSSMRRAAGQNEAAKQQWDKALESLGLRSSGTELRGGKGPTDQLRDLKQSRRIAPPPGWAEQFRAYTESVAGGDKDE